jgi:hypothetical protein
LVRRGAERSVGVEAERRRISEALASVNTDVLDAVFDTDARKVVGFAKRTDSNRLGFDCWQGRENFMDSFTLLIRICARRTDIEGS